MGIQNGNIVFVLTHDSASTALADEPLMLREPDGLLSDLGRHGSVWYFEEVELVGENTPGVWQPWEIHRLWPAQLNVDAAWLTDYSGVSGDSQPDYRAYTPNSSEYFNLFDQILLESDRLDRFGFHVDCRIGKPHRVGTAIDDHALAT